MKIVEANRVDLLPMLGWFSSQQQVDEWAGHGFVFPYDQQSFMGDLGLDERHSYAIVSCSADCLAFGQFYPRSGYCHLCRLVVNPLFRGRGIVTTLLTDLCRIGKKTLLTDQFSLFVMENNLPAQSAYRRFGFRIEQDPQQRPVSGCLFMTKKQ